MAIGGTNGILGTFFLTTPLALSNRSQWLMQGAKPATTKEGSKTEFEICAWKIIIWICLSKALLKPLVIKSPLIPIHKIQLNFSKNHKKDFWAQDSDTKIHKEEQE